MTINSALLERILAQVDEQAIVRLACDLIRIPSFKTEETLVAGFLTDFFQSRGYQLLLQEVEPERYQTIATLPGTGSGKSLMLNGHTDINSLGRRWKRDPWTPSVEGDRLYGHGIQNMKGGLASIIMAVEAVRLSDVKLKGDLVVACVVGETQGGEGTYHLMESGFRTDMAVVAEPFGLGNLATVHAGIVHMAIHTYGVTGHIRETEGPVNAVLKMMHVIDRLQSVEFVHEPRSDMPLLPRLNVGSIIGGIGSDYVLVEPPYIPDLCTIMVDVHFVPGQTVESIVKDIHNALDPLMEDDEELDYEIEIPPPDSFEGRRRLVMDPLDVPNDEYIVQAVARNHELITGRPPNVIGAVLPSSYSANDTCHLWNAGIPCLIYGPGAVRGNEDEDDSYAIISEMVDCAKVLAATALEVCNTETG
ncbi:MAG: M20/M25/M40 family metallo-hydrolase [SAR202 cluster bacterium]|jgi:acetylornithine deacetylase|nr:M20/M25/M40 family metallo-hydrolase [SAR202 cluster bacterium]MDP6714338.1 M20/M25/M40 family metallo-hydrolase [SAR202 cluster bacterium]